MSAEMMAILIGTIAGVVVGTPLSALILIALSRRDSVRPYQAKAERQPRYYIVESSETALALPGDHEAARWR